MLIYTSQLEGKKRVTYTCIESGTVNYLLIGYN